MEKKPLETLISVTGLWMSRAGVLHKIKHNEVSPRNIYLETVCGNRILVNNSRNSRTARALRHLKFRKTCKHCKISVYIFTCIIIRTHCSKIKCIRACFDIGI